MRRNRHLQIEAEIIIEKLNERGYGVGSFEGREVHVLNALPGEKVKIDIFKRRKGINLAHIVEILEPADYRLPHKEDHYLSCSPWQIIPIDKETEVKKDLIKGFFKDSAKIELPKFDIVNGDKEYNYRNKVEFSFYGHEDDHVTFAFHTRESGFHKIPADSCVLLPDIVNDAAEKVIKWINDNGIKARQLKGLLLRYSYFEDKVIGCLFVKDQDLRLKDNVRVQDFEPLHTLPIPLQNFLIIHSDFRSPAFVETEVLYKSGEMDLTEKVLDQKLMYSYNGFFQINPPVFEKAMEDIRNYITKIQEKDNLIAADIYAGVGTIGLGIADLVKKVIGVEITFNTKKYALLNAQNNNIANFSFFEGLAEKEGLEYVKSDILILDPPRVGVHQKVVKQIIEDKPQIIIYLSCNPKTQAENIGEFKDLYNIEFFKGYNFYPHTPHVESLCILKKKD